MYGLKERTLGSLAHISLPLVNLSIGIYHPLNIIDYSRPVDLFFSIITACIPALLISSFFCLLLWLGSRKFNSWVSFHALQAAIYQLIIFAACFTFGICGQGAPYSFLIFLIFFIVSSSLAYPIYGTLMTFKGKEFNYWLIGKPLKRKGLWRFIKGFVFWYIAFLLLGSLVLMAMFRR